MEIPYWEVSSELFETAEQILQEYEMPITEMYRVRRFRTGGGR